LEDGGRSAKAIAAEIEARMPLAPPSVSVWPHAGVATDVSPSNGYRFVCYRKDC
jgi:hypothetical protein